jgi:protein-tyrosine phosphatase
MVTAPLRVLMVCLGNICRSPTAHAVFQQRLVAAGLHDQVLVDSAGTGDYHIGAAPDVRTRAAGAARGYDMSALRARQVRAEDFLDFDFLLAMDENNLRDLERQCPPAHRHKLRLFMDFANDRGRSVPDPYYGEAESFQQVLDLVECAADGLLLHIRSRLSS